MGRWWKETFYLVFFILFATSQRYTRDTKTPIIVSIVATPISNQINEIIVSENFINCFGYVPMGSDGCPYGSLKGLRSWRKHTFCITALTCIEWSSGAEQERLAWLKEYTHQSCSFLARNAMTSSQPSTSIKLKRGSSEWSSVDFLNSLSFLCFSSISLSIATARSVRRVANSSIPAGPVSGRSVFLSSLLCRFKTRLISLFCASRSNHTSVEASSSRM